MNFKELWKRAELGSLRAYLKHGYDDDCEFSHQPYPERIHRAERNISDFLTKKFPDFKECDEVETFLNEQIFELENVYFEVGLLMGAKLAFDTAKRIEELK